MWPFSTSFVLKKLSKCFRKDFQPDVAFLATAVGDGGCEGSTVLGGHHVVDYRVYRWAKMSFDVIIKAADFVSTSLEKKTWGSKRSQLGSRASHWQPSSRPPDPRKAWATNWEHLEKPEQWFGNNLILRWNQNSHLGYFWLMAMRRRWVWKGAQQRKKENTTAAASCKWEGEEWM